MNSILDRVTFKHTVSLLMLAISASGAFIVLLSPDFSAEIKGSVVTLMLIGGWTAVQNFWLGSSSGSDVKTTLLETKPVAVQTVPVQLTENIIKVKP